MSFFYQHKIRPMKKARKEKHRYTVKKKTFNIFLSLVVLSALFIYLIQSNSLLTWGYKLKEVEKKVQETKRMKKELESKSLELQSMSVLAPKIEKLKMVEIDQAKYLSSQEKSMVKK